MQRYNVKASHDILPEEVPVILEYQIRNELYILAIIAFFLRIKKVPMARDYVSE